jgi:hypothetical protein
VLALKVDHGAARQRAVDAVHGEVGERKYVVQAPLQGRHERAVAAEFEHDARACGRDGETIAGVNAGGGGGARARFGGRDSRRHHRPGGQRRTQRE